MKFEEKLIQLRKARGLSQEALAEQLGVSRQASSRWELGETTPDLAKLKQLSELYGVSTDYLLHDEYTSDEDLPKVKETTQTFRSKEIARSYIFFGLALLWLLIGLVNILFGCIAGTDVLIWCSLFHFFNAGVCGFVAYRSKR